MSQDVGLTWSGVIVFEETHEQGQGFAHVVGHRGPKVYGIRDGFGGTGYE